MVRRVAVLTAVAIPTTATGLGLIVGALVSLWVGVGAALVVVGASLWLLASNLAVPEPAIEAAVETWQQTEPFATDTIGTADVPVPEGYGEPETGIARLHQVIQAGP